MRWVITISFCFLLAACSRKAVPVQMITLVKDTTITRVEYRDSIIRIPGETIAIRDTIPCAKDDVALRYLKEVSGKRSTLRVNLSGNKLAVECNVDSLEKVIRGLNEKITNTKSVVVEKPVEVKVPTPYIPRWVWYTMSVLAGLVVITNWKSILKFFKIILAFG